MKLSSLDALVMAVNEGSLRAAARKLGVTQPGLTKMVRELERQLDAPLLARTTKGVAPTAEGKILYARAIAARHELDAATQQIGQMHGRMIGELRVGAVPLALLLLIPEAVRTFGKAFPDISLQLREELYVGQLTLLKQRQVDVVVGPVPSDLPRGEYHVTTLMPIEMAVVVGKGNTLAAARSLAQLADARWVYTSLSGQTGYVRVLFEQHGLTPPPPAAVVNSTLGLMSLIAHGHFAGLMPLPIARHPAARLFMEIVPVKEGPLSLEIGAIVPADAMLKPAVRHFVTHLHRAAGHVHTTGQPFGLG